MNTPRILRISALVAVVGFSFLSGYWGRGLQVWFSNMGRPVVHTDVSANEMVKLGFPFGRPSEATRVVTAIVGNGMGDTAAYASFDLPKEEAGKFMQTLQSEKGFQETHSHFEPYYLEQLPASVSDALWPRKGLEHATVLQGHGVLIGHAEGSARIHAFYTCCAP